MSRSKCTVQAVLSASRHQETLRDNDHAEGESSPAEVLCTQPRTPIAACGPEHSHREETFMVKVGMANRSYSRAGERRRNETSCPHLRPCRRSRSRVSVACCLHTLRRTSHRASSSSRRQADAALWSIFGEGLSVGADGHIVISRGCEVHRRVKARHREQVAFRGQPGS